MCRQCWGFLRFCTCRRSIRAACLVRLREALAGSAAFVAGASLDETVDTAAAELERLLEHRAQVLDAIADAELERVLVVWQALVQWFGRDPIVGLASALRERRQLGAQAHELPPALVLRALRDFLDAV